MKPILKRLIWLIMAVPAIYLAIIWNKLPEKVVMHYDLRGKPGQVWQQKRTDNYGCRTYCCECIDISTLNQYVPDRSEKICRRK